MAKGKNSSEKPSPKKTAAKKSGAKTTTAEKSVAGNVAAAPVSEPNPSTAELHDEIRSRAYEIYSERGGQHGMDEADWHRAESEVRSKHK